MLVMFMFMIMFVSSCKLGITYSELRAIRQNATYCRLVYIDISKTNILIDIV